MLQPNAIIRLSSTKMLDSSLVIHAINLAWASTKCEVETHPLEYGIILGSSDLVKSAIPQCTSYGPRLDFLKCNIFEILQRYVGLENWNKTALIVDRERMRIEGIINFSGVNTEDPYEFITGITSSVCVVSKRVFSVRVYYDGKFQVQYIFNRKSGVIEERIPESFLTFWKKREVNQKLARRIMDISLRISEMRKGCSFMIGSPRDLHKLSIISHAERILKPVYELSASEIINYATADGSTWIDKQGLLRGYGLKFAGPGGRLAIAKSICRENEKITALVVSQDGEINIVYQNEKRRLASQITSDNLLLSKQS